MPVRHVRAATVVDRADGVPDHARRTSAGASRDGPGVLGDRAGSVCWERLSGSAGEHRPSRQSFAPRRARTGPDEEARGSGGTLGSGCSSPGAPTCGGGPSPTSPKSMFGRTRTRTRRSRCSRGVSRWRLPSLRGRVTPRHGCGGYWRSGFRAGSSRRSLIWWPLRGRRGGGRMGRRRPRCGMANRTLALSRLPSRRLRPRHRRATNRPPGLRTRCPASAISAHPSERDPHVPQSASSAHSDRDGTTAPHRSRLIDAPCQRCPIRPASVTGARLWVRRSTTVWRPVSSEGDEKNDSWCFPIASQHQFSP